QLLVPSGKVDDGIFSSLVSQIKVSNQTLLFETDLIPEGTIRDLAVQIGQEFPDVVASEAEVKEAALKAADVKAGAERFAWWCNVGKNGKRLAKITFNRDRIFDFLEKHNKGLGAATIDEACAALDAS